MISYGSRNHNAAMPMEKCSHQLGEGQPRNTGMSVVVHPSRLVYGRNTSRSQKCQAAIDTFHQLGKGHQCDAEMPKRFHPSRLVSRRPINRYRNVTPTPPPEGRVIRLTQQCLSHHTLPHQFMGAISRTQKCYVANAPTSYGRNTSRSQQCQTKPFLPPVLGHP